MGDKSDRNVEKTYSTSEFVAKLCRLADALERGERFEIRVAGEGDEEEVGFQLKRTNL